ncbi:MAG TPA: signal recognition particle protein [Phycisphaerae bacterium]|nr:signal recognition particle protein [Phycisphaerae bacterium]
MFESLQDKFGSLFRNLTGKGKISESNVRDAMKEVRTALLEADVHYDVVNKFVAEVTEKAVGTVVLSNVEPGQQMIKIVYDELIRLMGTEEEVSEAGAEGAPRMAAQAPRIMFVDPPPTIVMMCGLQGSGKTTTCGKLAQYLKSKGKNPLLVAADLQRPAAIDQLNTLGEQTGVPVYAERENKNPVQVCRGAVEFAKKNGRDVVILDTAGRLHIDQPLMDELRAVNLQLKPHQIFLVVDAMVGQDAVNSAKAFNEQLELDGIILTKFDSDTRGGAALSVKTITGKPIKFMGTGEKLDALEEFFPERIAQRMLGMGDILTLVEKAQSEFDEAKAAKLQEKMAKATFTLDDFLEQMRSVRKMGPLKQLMGLLPGIGSALKDVQLPEEELNKTEAIIQSMTKKERENPDGIDGSRRRRIARGAGTQAEDVAKLIKGFSNARDFAKKMSGMSMGARLKMAQAMSQFDMSKLAPGGAAGGLPRVSTQQPKSRLTPEQKRKLRDKRLRGK